MKQRAFQAMLAELFRVTGSAGTRALPGVGHCRCFGLDVSLYYDDKIDQSSVHAYIDLGPVSPARQREVFRKLLLRNPNHRPTHSAVLGLDADTDRIVLVARIALDDTLSGQQMATILAQLIKHAHVWRLPTPSVRLGTGKVRALRRPS
jgi:hypothetical protein